MMYVNRGGEFKGGRKNRSETPRVRVSRGGCTVAHVINGVPLSILEIISFDAAHPVPDGAGLVDVAQRAERSGYRRIWDAEHHLSSIFAALSPTVVMSRVASATSTIRVGSGGVLAVNHVPVELAEQFAALTTF